MSQIDWRMAIGPNVAETFMGGFERGQAMAKERAQQNALAQYAQNPTGEGAINALAQVDPRMAIQARQQQVQERDRQAQMQLRQQELAGKQQQQQREQMLAVGKLLDGVNDEATYQQRLQTARGMGFDVSRVPQAYDPNWVRETKTVADLFNKDGGQTISGIARELQDAGYQPGTPQFEQAMKGVIQNKYATDYVDEQGNTRRRSALQLDGAPSATPAAGPPAPGAMVNGYTFKGGDPKDRSNWVQGGQTARPSGTFLGGFAGLPGETVTSTFRTPEHNKRVGGVSNSFHTRRTSDGKPMARDSVPPPGMSMAAYAAQLRRLNPNLDVINEGDHVHMEPKG